VFSSGRIGTVAENHELEQEQHQAEEDSSLGRAKTPKTL